MKNLSRRRLIKSSLACSCMPFIFSASHAAGSSSLCAFTRMNAGGNRGFFKASAAAIKDADDVYLALGLGKRNIPIYATYEVANAAAFPNLNGARAIAYNPDFMSQLYDIDGWAPVSVMAHEIGHHFAKNSTNRNSHRRELAADQVSGCAMAWMNASENEATVAMLKGLPVNSGSPSHPGTNERVNVISRAFSKCGRLKTEEY